MKILRIYKDWKWEETVDYQLLFHFCLYFIRTVGSPFEHKLYLFLQPLSKFHFPCLQLSISVPPLFLILFTSFPPCLIFLPLILTSLPLVIRNMQCKRLKNTIEGLTHSSTFRGSAQFCSSSPPQKQNKEETGEGDEGR